MNKSNEEWDLVRDWTDDALQEANLIWFTIVVYMFHLCDISRCTNQRKIKQKWQDKEKFNFDKIKAM